MGELFETLEKQRYFIIAEIGVNYYDIAKKENISNLDAAKLMCYEAKNAGVDAVKFQTYKAEKIASKFSPAYWDTSEEPTKSQFELFQKYDLFGQKEYEEIALYCKEIGVLFLSTPFDFEAVDYLDSLMEYYKISSSDITNIPFIRYICKKGKPILLSTGASTEDEIDKALTEIKESGNKVILMHCVLEYPTPDEHANLRRISALKNKYPEMIMGFSDHTKPEDRYDVIKTAYILGAEVIEKHFTLDKNLTGNDHYHAMDVTDVKKIKKHLERLKIIMGKNEISYLESEEPARMNARRSIVALNDLKKGYAVRREDICFKRPGTGISPELYKSVEGRYVSPDIKADTILKWDDLI